MKILALNGSHRGKKGVTQALINQIALGARDGGAGFENVVLAERRIEQCLGCEVCHTEKSYLKCVFAGKDDVKGILERMAEADIIIYATPIYIFNMSGLMKRFLDRINSIGDSGRLAVSKKGLFFHHIDRAVCSKPFVVLTVCGNIEDETSRSVVSYFKTFSRFMDAPMVGVLTAKSSLLLKKEGDKAPPKKALVISAFREAGRELAESGRIARKTMKHASQHVIDLPYSVRLLMMIRPMRARMVKEGLRRDLIHFK
jgi:multimeric flavodoxin WrbA